MKIRIFTLLLTFLFILKVSAQEVEAVQRTLLTKRAASWCPPCGGWGWTFFDNLLLDNEGKAVFFAAHHSGNLVTDVAIEMTNNFGGDYQPEFFVNHVKQSVNSSNTASFRTQIKNQVDAAFNANPVANSGFTPVYQDGAIKVDAKVKFFQAAQGEFYLGLYLVEDHVISFQQNQGNNADHRKILRESFTQSTWGEMLENGNVAAGTEFSKSFSLPIGDPAGYDYEIVGIIWKKVGSKYELVNVWSTTTIETSSGTSQIVALQSIEVSPTIVTTQALVKMELKSDLLNARIDLIDINGRKVFPVFEGNLAAGEHSFPIERKVAGANGVYFIRFSSGKEVATRKVIFE